MESDILMIKFKRRELAYLATPYSAVYHDEVHFSIEDNLRIARQAHEILQRKYDVFCPAMNSAYMDDCAHFARFYEKNISMLRVADTLVLLEDFEYSKGCVWELIVWRSCWEDRSEPLVFMLYGLEEEDRERVSPGTYYLSDYLETKGLKVDFTPINPPWKKEVKNDE